MGKTFKRFPDGYYRSPRGRKRALIQGARNRSVPPSSWEDIRADKQAWFPAVLARRFYKRSMGREEAIRKLRKKFCLSQREALEPTSCWEIKSEEDYAKDAFERRSPEEKVAIRLRYRTLVEWHREFLSSPQDDE